MRDMFELDDCPDSVWELLPGGRDAADEAGIRVWEYRGTFDSGRRLVHSFQHDRHPRYGHATVHAHIADTDAGPRLASLLVLGAEEGLPGDTGQELQW